MFAQVAKAVFGSSNDRYVAKIRKIVEKINTFEPNISAMSDDDLKNQTVLFRERLAKGETIGHMAEAMFLSVKTVSTYRTRVLEKLKLSSNSDLTYYALKNGLIQ